MQSVRSGVISAISAIRVRSETSPDRAGSQQGRIKVMDWNSAVSKGCFRYIVPFTFDNSFEEAVALTEKQMDPEGSKKHAWIRRIPAEDKRESDLYDYIRCEARFDDAAGDLPDEKIGCEWLLYRSEEIKQGDGKKILDLLYFETPAKAGDTQLPPSWNVYVSNLGLVLYRNHLGFIWYELSLPVNRISAEQLVMFQNRIRELNRGTRGEKNTWLWKKCRQLPDYGIMAGKRGGFRGFIEPFLFGTWIAEQTGFLQTHFIAERHSAYRRIVISAMGEVSSVAAEKRTFDVEALTRQARQNLFGDAEPEAGAKQENLLRQEVRRLTAQSVVVKYPKVPDKALLFSYCSFENYEEDPAIVGDGRYALTYWLANGYNPTYHFSEERKQSMQMPLADVLWYATQEGAAYLVWAREDNRNFYAGTIISKIQCDYFTMYLKVLYQSYSLLLYAQRIQKDISAKNGGHLAEGAGDKITEIYEEINLFLTKSMATSVSHIDHQSGFYNYLKKQLRVQEDVASVTAGLNALDSLKREQKQREETARLQAEWKKERERDHQAAEAEKKREEREKQAEEAEKRRDSLLQLVLGLFGLIGIASAFLDGYQFIVEWNSGNISGNMAANLEVFFIGITIIGIVTLAAIIIAIYHSLKK